MINEGANSVRGSTIEQSLPRFHGDVYIQIKDIAPARILHVQRTQHRIRQVQKLRLPRGNQQRHMPRRVPGRRNGLNAGNDLLFPFEQIDAPFERWQILLSAIHQQLLHVPVHGHVVQR